MTGLFYHHVIKLTAKINLVYLIYVLVSLYMGSFPIYLFWQKALFIFFIVNMSIHGRFGLWAVITDYVPNKLQTYVIRLVEIYLLGIITWSIIMVCV